MKLPRIIFLAACFAAFFSSCTWDAAEEAGCPSDINCTHFGQDSMTYTHDIKQILTTYCTAGGDTLGDCHQASSSLGYDFTTFDGVSGYVSLFNYYVFDPATATMPKSISHGPTTLSCCDLEKLKLWIAQGAHQ